MYKKDSNVITYEPDNSLKKGYGNIFGEIFNEIINNRWLIYQLFRRDFLALYKQSFIGILWAFIIPLISVGTFIILNRSGIFSIGRIDVPYPIYAVLGIMFWQVFSVGLLGGANALVKAGSMIVKINFSKKSLVIAATGQALVSFFIQFAVLGILFAGYGIVPHPSILLIPILIIPLLLLTLGISLILSILNGIMRDIGNLLSVFLSLIMFLTPILYVKPDVGMLSELSRYNVLYYLISVPRDLVLQGATAQWPGFVVSSAAAVAIFLACLIVFHLTETRVAERI
ncbi:MAG: ABC transporter permease [Candidatus Omnitrophica bacterium]|nr:ABC transporter permease [Candidatus Omnitrophota bacterium]